MTAIYLRQSVDKKDSISVASQLEFCKYEVKDDPYRIYTDKGFSGKNTNRPQFQEMLGDIKSGSSGIDRVVVYKLDRISRSVLDFSNLMALFQKYGVDFVSSTEKFDTGTPMGRAMLNICIVFAQLERETIQQRVRDAYMSRMQKGYYMGGRIPYGFKKTKIQIDGVTTSKYETVDEEAEQIRLIFEMYADINCSMGDIAAYFRENGVKRRNQQVWDRARIGDLLKNPVYVKADSKLYDFLLSNGVHIINTYDDFIGTNGCYLYKGENSRKKSDLSNTTAVLAPHEGFIDSDLWIKCRERLLNARGAGKNPKAKNTWLSGLVKCGECGFALVRKNYKNSRKSYYLCSNKMNSKACAGAGTIYAQELEQIVEHEILNRLENEFKTLSKEKEQLSDPKLRELRSALAKTEREINGLLKKLGGADDMMYGYLSGQIKTLHEKRSDTETQINGLIEKSSTNADAIADYIGLWDDLSFNDKRTVAHLMIQVIKAKSDYIEIQWRF